MPNDINSDANGQAHWRFESGAFLLDETAKNNDLNNSGVATIAGGAQLEGNQSADFEQDDPDYLWIADGALSADFPLKNGDTNKLISICMRFKTESSTTNGYLFSKYDTNSKRSLAIYYTAATNFIQIALGYNNGDSFQNKNHASSLSDGTEYFLCVIIDGINKTHFIHIYNMDTPGVVGSDIDATFDNVLHVEDGLFTLGAVTVAGTPQVSTMYDGIQDDVCVFNRLLDKTTTITGEIADLRNEVFSAAGGIVPILDHHYRMMRSR